jgi:type II secretory pathway component PulK
MCFRSRIKKLITDQRGVALFMVLAAMATLAIFVGEITYTAAINQKLAYDRLDQIKAQALAKSGLRIALLRIRAYDEIRKTVSSMAGAVGADAAAVNSVVPKAILEKIWSEPITIPFSGDVSSLPSSARDALLKFRKDSGMEGKLYISIQAQSSRFNLNSTVAAFAPTPTPSPSPTSAGATTGGTTTGGPAPDPSSTPAAYDVEQARNLLVNQLKDTFAQKFQDDEKFRDRYRNLRIEDLADEILGWSDLTYPSQRAQSSNIPFKQAPFYHVSELHYLPSVDDEIYDLIAPQYTAGVNSQINVNTITETVLRALVPSMTAEERKKFFDFRAGIQESGTASASPGGNQDNTFKDPAEFLKYIQDKVAAFGGSATKISDFKTALIQRGIELVTEENSFIVRIEATVQQTKKTLEANVTLVPQPKTTKTVLPGQPADPNAAPQKSNLKITQLRFL